MPSSCVSQVTLKYYGNPKTRHVIGFGILRKNSASPGCAISQSDELNWHSNRTNEIHPISDLRLKRNFARSRPLLRPIAFSSMLLLHFRGTLRLRLNVRLGAEFGGERKCGESKRWGFG
uniref:Uncharacterized protein n=1 Tax=Opuntia streptacantha TaxID=393608 RepID=A0A7C9ETY8_OPUST